MDPTHDQKEFWMLYCPEGHAPTVRHPTLESAVAESRRLANMCPGKRFFILESIGMAVRQDPVTVETWGCSPDDLPF